jgi:Zn-dependent protease
MQGLDIIYSIIVLLMSVVVHEVSHGYAALYLGDPTAKYAKRLTLNPIRHIDIIGSIVIPAITVLAGGFIFGWAKPVPYNPYNLKNPKRDEAIIALAGPVSNLIIAVVASLVIAFFGPYIGIPAISLLTLIMFINIALMVFNLMPIYPLDGSKVLFSLLPYKYSHLKEGMIKYSLFIFVFFILFFSRFLSSIIYYVVSIISFNV